MITQRSTPQILNCNSTKTFWIRWSAGVISVGHDDMRTTPFMVWLVTNPHPVNFISLSTGNKQTGIWYFGSGTGWYQMDATTIKLKRVALY